MILIRIVLFILLLAPMTASGNILFLQQMDGGSGGEGEAPTCSTALWSNTSSVTGDVDIHDRADDSYKFNGQYFEDSTERTIYCVEIDVTWKLGDISGKTFRGAFTTVNGSNVLNVAGLVEADDTVTGSNAWSITRIQFKFTGGFTASASTKYAFVITMDGVGDPTNYAELEYTSTSVFPNGGWNVWSATGIHTATSPSDARAIFYTD